MEKISKNMEKAQEAVSAVPNKRKRKMKVKGVASEPKAIKLSVEPKEAKVTKPAATVFSEGKAREELLEKYPILKNQDLIDKFLRVTMTNNQKGRIRQLLRDNLKGTASVILPDVIHNRIQNILKTTPNLTDTELRKIRILYNMLQTAVKDNKEPEKPKKKKKKAAGDTKEKADGKVETGEVKKEKRDGKIETGEVNKENGDVKKEPKEQLVKKVKGPKRYVVFLGNLPLNIDKDKIMNHFSELNEQIKDIRLPKIEEGKKSAIAYVELANEPSYELALSKHHSMLGTKRINVLYTTHKNSKISKAEAKSKSAKLIALQKSGKLLGSVPLNKKRSQRRLKMKKALKAAEAS